MNHKEFINEIYPLKDKLFRLAKKMLTSIEEAEDATQEVFSKLWNGRNYIKTYNSAEAFAMKMTKNYCLDVLKSKRANISTLSLVHTKNLSHSDKFIENQDSLSYIKKMMNSLPDTQKLILHLRDIEEYEYNEIAKILEMNEASVRVAASRARKEIREKLIKHKVDI